MRFIHWFSEKIIDIAAAAWTRRAPVIEVAGGAALVIAGALVTPPLGWAIAGCALVAKAQEVDRKAKARR